MSGTGVASSLGLGVGVVAVGLSEEGQGLE